MFIGPDDIEDYDWIPHIITFKPGVIDGLWPKIRKYRTFGSDVPFVVVVNGVEAYRGKFISSISCVSAQGRVIVLDGSYDVTWNMNQRRLGWDYPPRVRRDVGRFRVPMPPDAPCDERIRSALETLGKLRK